MVPVNHFKLRPHVVREPVPRAPRSYYLTDQLGLAPDLCLSADERDWLDFFDGTRSLAEVQARGLRDADGRIVSLERLAHFAARLDENLFLDGPRFRDIVDARVRRPRHIGCYEGDPERLRRQLTAFFTDPRGPGLPGQRPARADLRAALIPHIDYPRGGVTYAWGFKEVVEQTSASLFVIIGTSHYSTHRFILTRKDFQTPLGITPTDQDYIDRLVTHYGPGLFDDEWLAHLPEHSIELEVVFLQYLYEGKRPIRIVPLVVGSFFDCVAQRGSPTRHADIAGMIEALRRAETETREPICYIISGDLAHIGPKFDDPIALTPDRLARSRQQDLAILREAESASPARYFKIIADEHDARNICGLPPTFTVLEALRPSGGKTLHYDQYVEPRGHESVSFASVAFYGSR